MSGDPVLREATRADLAGLWEVRYAVRENTLTPGRIGDDELRASIEDQGRGWVIEQDGRIDAFAIGLAAEGSVWALFVHPRAQGRGFGDRLHARLLQWFAEDPRVPARLWLGTGADTRALGFYLRRGWQDVGPYGRDERRLERDRPAPVASPHAQTIATFDRHAAAYDQKYTGLQDYDDTYEAFVAAIDAVAAGGPSPPASPHVLDLACGPGVLPRWIAARRPHWRLTGMDAAPAMLAQARQALPGARWLPGDLRELPGLAPRLQLPVDGLACAFGLPYLAPDEVLRFLDAAARMLRAGGVLYLSLRQGPTAAAAGAADSPAAGPVEERNAQGDCIHTWFHPQPWLAQALTAHGFAPGPTWRRAPPGASAAGASPGPPDLILLAHRLST